MREETINIIVLSILLFIVLFINPLSIGNRPYSMHYKSHGLVERKGVIKLLYFKPKHFHRYHISEVISYFLSFFYLIFGIVFAIVSELNPSLNFVGMDVLAISYILFMFFFISKIIYMEITYRKEEKYRIGETNIEIDDKLMNEIFKYAGTIRFNLDHSYDLRLKKIDPNDKEKINELDREYIQYYKDYKKIYVKNNKVYYITTSANKKR